MNSVQSVGHCTGCKTVKGAIFLQGCRRGGRLTF